MRIFADIVGGLFILFAVLVGAFGALVLADADSDGSLSCSGSSSSTYCTGDPARDSQYQAVGLAFVVGASALFVGGCALVAGAVAAGREPTSYPQQYAPQPGPAPSAGPPSYGGGGGTWQGSPATGGDRS